MIGRMPQVAQASRTTPHSAIREIGGLAAAYPEAIRLEIGDPTFVTAPHIINAAAAAARGGYTKYTPSAGLPRLRELLVEKLRSRNGIECSAADVVVTTGGCGAIFSSLVVLLDPGDEVLVPDPGWPNYVAMAHMLNAPFVHYPLLREQAFEPDFDALESRVTRRTKAIIVNTPSNPTGAVYSREVMRRMADFAARHDLWLISDECYDDLVFDGEHVSMARIADPERTISVFSFSKAYAMTGWRVGYLVTEAGLASSISKTQESIVLNTAAISQKAAEAALVGPQDHREEMRLFYRDRRDEAMALLDEAGVDYSRAAGAFYLMVALPRGTDSRAFALSLLDTRRVAVTPGIGFGPSGEGMIRISLSNASETLRLGLEQLVGAVAGAPAYAS
jgi:aspartate/methionine/tyrosine aminotransferase